jgi:hypothetical protein
MKVYARGHRKSGNDEDGWTSDNHSGSNNSGYTKNCGSNSCDIDYKSYCGDRRDRIEDDDRFKIQNCDLDKKAHLPLTGRIKLCSGKNAFGDCDRTDYFSQCNTVCGDNIKGKNTYAKNPCWDTNKRGFIKPSDENVGFENQSGPFGGAFFGLQCEYKPDEAQVVKSSGIDEHTNTLGFDGVKIKDTDFHDNYKHELGSIYQQLKWGANDHDTSLFDTREQGLCSKPENSEKKVDAKEPKATTCFEDGRIQWSGGLKDSGKPNAYRSKQYKEVALHHCTKVPNAEDNLRDKIFKTGSSDKMCHIYFRNEVNEKDLIEKFCLKTENSGPVNMTKSENNDLCSRERMGDNKYEAMAAQYCLNNPTDLWCGCYNAVENKCKIDESLPGCNESLHTWEEMKSGLSSDESALFSGMRQCFKNVCAGNKYKPNNWKEACNRRVNICKSEIDIAGKMVGSTIIDQQDCNNEGAPPPSIKPLSKTDKFLENIFSFREDQDKKFMEKRYVKISIAILLILILGAVISGTIIIV